MRPSSRQRPGSLTTRYQTPQRTPQRFSKEVYFQRKLKHFTFDLSSSMINECIPAKKQLKPAIHIQQLGNRIKKFAYLPLHLFEDSSFDRFSNQDLFLKIQRSGPITAFVLNNQNEFVEGKIVDYNHQTQLFNYQSNDQFGEISRLYFLCDFENVKLYVQKFEKALNDREAMDNVLRYNYYIDNMQTQDIPELSVDKIQRIQKLIGKVEQGHAIQINTHYKRVQNEMQLNSYLKHNKDVLNFQLAIKGTKPVIPEFGKIQLKFKEMMIVHRDFVDYQPTSFEMVKKQFQEISLFVLPELIKSFFYINELNNYICSLELLYWDKKPYSILQLKEKQDQLVSRQFKVISKWSERIKGIMKDGLQELEQKGVILQEHRLKRIISVIRIKQLESLSKLIVDNVTNFRLNFLKKKQSVFQISVGYFGGFQYSFDVLEITNIYCNSLANQLLELSKIRDPECIMNISDLMYLQCISQKDQLIQDFVEELTIAVQRINSKLIDHLKKYMKYQYIFEWKLEDFVKDCTTPEDVFDLQLFKQQILKLQSLQIQLTKEIAPTDWVSIFIIDNTHLLFQINQLLEKNIFQMMEYISGLANNQIKETTLQFQKLMLMIKKQNNDIIGLENHRNFLNHGVAENIHQLEINIKETLKVYEILDELSYISSSEQMKERWNLLSYVNMCKQQITESLEDLMEKRIQQKYDFQQELLHFKYTIDDSERKINNFVKNFSVNQTNDQTFMKELLDLKQQAVLMNQYETVFNLQQSNFGKIDFIIQQLQPLENLQRLMKQWKNNTWMQMKISELNTKQIQEFTENSLIELQEILVFSNEKRMTSITQLSQSLLLEIKEFSPHLPLILALTEPGMRQRHWDQLNKLIAQQVDYASKSLQELLNLFHQDIRKQVIEISFIAKQELIVEQTYLQLCHDFHNLTAQIIKPRIQLQNFQFNKLVNLDQLFQKLDDSLCSLSIILQSKYHDPWKQELAQLESQMIYTQTIVQQFDQMQQLFQYIHPVFLQNDLQKQLPIEVSRFKGVEKFWKMSTNEFSGQQIHKYKSNQIEEQIHKLQMIEKSLSNYIDKKREIFQRFHFLSNQQILLIQSKATKPNDFIDQIFLFNKVEMDEDGITQLQIQDKLGKVTERLNIETIKIYSKNVEDWLHDLILVMRKTLKNQILKSSQSKQIKILMDKIEWTQHLDDQFKNYQDKPNYKYKHLSQISPDSFEYQIQLKYYLNENKEIIIQFLNYNFSYDYEFLQESDLFIETPQTDRCFANLAFAISSQFGSFLYGNSGKIETIKQFSNCLGKYFIVMNAEISNYQILTHLCKGVSATGSFFALTKCSEMRLDLLSIFVQLVKVLYFAIRNSLHQIELEGSTIKVEPTFSFFLIGGTKNTINSEIRYYFRPIYFQKIDLAIFIDFISQEYELYDSITQLKQFVYLYQSIKRSDISMFKIKQIVQQAITHGMYNAIQINFQEPEFQEIIHSIWPKKEEIKPQLKDLLLNNCYVLLFGESLTGKSLQISQLSNYHKIYLSSYPLSHFFGSFESEGVISQILNKIGNNILVIDCELDDKLIELFLPLILFQQIRFPNGKSLQLNNQIIFETPTISNLSPNVITKISSLYLSGNAIEIPKYAQNFCCLAGMYKNPISNKQQLHIYQQILKKIKGQSTPEFETVFAATWAFGSALTEELRMLLNRHIKEIWQQEENKSVDPLTYDNLFEYILEDGQLVPNEKGTQITKLLEFIPNIILYGNSGSGKSHYLQNPLRVNLNTKSSDLQSFLQSKLIKKRNGVYSIGKVYIDDIHLLNANSIEFLRELTDNQGYQNVKLIDLQLILTSQHISDHRYLKYFVIYFCESHSHQTIFSILQKNQIQNVEDLMSIYQNAQQFFIKHSRRLQVTCWDIWRSISNNRNDPSQFLMQSLFNRIDDDDLKITWVSQQKLFKSEDNENHNQLSMDGLIQFQANNDILKYLIKLMSNFPSNNKLILYGPLGVGKKTICKLACRITKLEYVTDVNSDHSQNSVLILDNPNFKEISQLVNQSINVILIMTTEHLEKCISKGNFMYKFQFLHFGDWPDDAFSSNEIGNIIYKYMKQQNHYTISPQSFVKYNELQEKLYKEKDEKLKLRINQLSNGLQLLYSAQQQINLMNNKLNQIRPILEQAVKDAQDFVRVLQEEQHKSQVIRDQVLEDEQVAEQEQQKASQLQETCKQRVSKVNVELEQTLQEVQKLKKEHLVEIKSLVQPTRAVKVILGGAVILLSDHIKYTGNQDDYFEIAKKYLLNDVKDLLDILKNYNKDAIKSIMIQQLESRIINDADFTLERAKQCSLAVKYLYSWVRAIYDYHKVVMETQPIRDELEESYRSLKEKTVNLEQKKKEVQEINMKLEECEFQVKEKQNVKVQLEQQIEECQTKIKRSLKLIEGFKEEQKRWTNIIYQLKGEQTRNEGDSIIATTLITYGGPLVKEHRNQMYIYLYKVLRDAEVKYSEKSNLNSYFNEESDNFISENANILNFQYKPVILIDPQNLGKQYLTEKYHYKVLNDPKKIQNHLQLKQPFYIDITDNIELLHHDPKMIHFTHEQNAKFQDQIYINYQIINYTITQEALVEKLLKCLIEVENPTLELKKQHNLDLCNQEKKQLIQIENQILNTLQNQKSIDELLNNEVMINQLHNSKQLYEETTKRIDMAKRLNEDIDLSRDQYRMLAQQISLIFINISNLQRMNPIYQYSLEWFLKQLMQQSSKIQRQNDIALNIQLIKAQFYKGIINEVSLLLNEEDRLIFCFSISLDILSTKGLITQEELDAFLGCQNPQLPPQFKIGCNPCIFIDDSEWPSIKTKLYHLNKLQPFHNILETIEDYPNQFKQVYLHQTFSTEQQKLTSFQKLLLTLAFRPDKVIPMMINIIEQQLQLKYNTIKTSINEIQFDSKTPLFIFNDSKSYSKLSVTLGEGQYSKAEKILRDSLEHGHTLEFLNCQFATPFLSVVEQILEENQAHPNFKLILQAKNCKSFPISWLNRTVKVGYTQTNNIVSLLADQIESEDKLDHPHFFSLNLFQAINNLRHSYGYSTHQYHESDLKLALSDQLHFSKELIFQSQLNENEMDLFNTLYNKTVCQQSLREGFIYMGGELKMIKSNKQGYLQYLKDLGQVNDFNCIGLNSNIQILIQIDMMKRVQQNIQLMQGTVQNNQILLEQLEKLERYTPLKLSDIKSESIVDLYYQVEKDQFNQLISRITEDVKAVSEYIRGESLTPRLEEIIQRLQLDEVPEEWFRLGEVKIKQFNLWLNKIFEKGQFFSKWNSQKYYNLNYFKNPKHFLNLIKLEFALKFNCGLDEVVFKQIFLKEHHLEILYRPDAGVYIQGLKVQGAKYNDVTQKMKALGHLEFQSDLPVLHLIPIQKLDLQLGSVFHCPILRNEELVEYLYFETQDPLILLSVQIKLL
ncbi:unnamed protein product (macronuclear) [Paramecium tetraurelia]|uniref:Dynein heavy chain linker domain-containing protein n=1 Tax=Paramecium tetraurelia TaxID=5888 RepID=A0DE06_PARTE|nr:uncharacterized protein GSPATT00016115001 [Paramecium tetraurelia]CAK81273.1 unnamed protein product [Paramecium tetraurelia]|eukprot:XP_001448670.1 hypothetical protein (macronuclear) [Paramecium tetraurelia strain d4-2]